MLSFFRFLFSNRDRNIFVSFCDSALMMSWLVTMHLDKNKIYRMAAYSLKYVWCIVFWQLLNVFCWIFALLMSLGWNCQCIKWVLSACELLLSFCLWCRGLSIMAAADCSVGIKSKIQWPRWRRREINLIVLSMKSSWEEFRFQKHRSSPVIRPLKQLAGWADKGGMYKYKLSSFWKVFVCIDWFLMLMVESKQVVVVVSSSIFHHNKPTWFNVVLKKNPMCWKGYLSRCQGHHRCIISSRSSDLKM